MSQNELLKELYEVHGRFVRGKDKGIFPRDSKFFSWEKDSPWFDSDYIITLHNHLCELFGILPYYNRQPVIYIDRSKEAKNKSLEIFYKFIRGEYGN